ncbi:MAG TPA: alpha/beta family hydrolase [Gaiellaceae bacterium]|nr:alpha/beta family hydrolase [Gaiellaceae bacterium]
MRELETPRGLARAHVHEVDNARALLVLGHGAGGGVNAPDLQTATKVALARDVRVVLVEQPYRVLGRRSPPPAPHLDDAWIAVVAQVRDELPLLVGGRSSGARVACRTATEVGAAGVLCLAFPLIAPSGASRQAELDGVAVPTLVVQGTRDRFGMPKATKLRTVAEVSADHALKSDREAVASAIDAWLVNQLDR